MNKQTKKLRDNLFDIWSDDCPTSVRNDITGQILQACKDSGLKFVDYGLPCGELGQTCEHRIISISPHPTHKGGV